MKWFSCRLKTQLWLQLQKSNMLSIAMLVVRGRKRMLSMTIFLLCEKRAEQQHNLQHPNTCSLWWFG